MLEELIIGFNLIAKSFISQPSIWWFLAPIFILWIIMEIYFGQYKKERIGWNSILANGVSFSWINIASFRVLFLEKTYGVNDFTIRIIILSLFFLYGITIIYIAFSHKLPEKLGYFIAGPTTIYFLSMVSVLWGQGVLEISKWILIDFIVIYFIIHLIFWLIKKQLGMLGEVEAIEKGEKPL